MNTGLWLIIGTCILIALASFIGGIICFVQYKRRRKVVWLIVGLVLTLILPGLFICLALGVFVPTTMVVYGPPPDVLP